MKIESIPQAEIGNISRKRIGDVLNQTISDDTFNKFRFAAAYMRMSGLNRLGPSLDSSGALRNF